jgi:hypothetical protein
VTAPEFRTAHVAEGPYGTSLESRSLAGKVERFYNVPSRVQARAEREGATGGVLLSWPCALLAPSGFVL